MCSFIPVNKPLLLDEDKNYLMKCIESGWISAEGNFVKELENLVSSFVGHTYGIAVSSGTAALEIAVKSLGIRNGDEVIMPSHTIISCAQAVIKAGGKPVLVDSDPDTWNMDVESIEFKITEKTKAILVPHLYGLPVPMDRVLDIAKKYQLFIIEDTSQMFGQTYKGKPCGGFGDISTFSFYPNKIITTGEGGMCTTKDENLAEKCRYYRNLCFDLYSSDRRFIHEDLGWNYRLSNIQAALGVSQMKRIQLHINRKREIGKIYNFFLKEDELLKDFFQFPLEATEYAENIYWVYGLVIKDKYPVCSLDLIRRLKSKGIGARPFFYPLHKQPVFRKLKLFENENYRIAEKLYQKGFYIPSGLGLTINEIEQVVNVLKSLVRELVKEL